MRKMKRRVTLYTILVIFTLVILLHVFLTCRLVSNGNALSTGVHFVFWTLSNIHNMVQTSEGRNGTTSKDPLLNQQSSRVQSSQGRSGTTRNGPVIIYWTKVFERQVKVGDKYTWPHFYTGDLCPVKCTLTTDHSMIDEASAIVIHARNIDEMPPQDKIRRKNIRWILHSNESPKFTSVLSSAKIMAKFNFYLSYRLDSDFTLSLFPKPLLEPLPVPFKKKRQTLAAALYSHCEAVRTEYLIELMQEIEIDSYGSCLHNTDRPEYLAPRDNQRFSKLSNPLINLYRSYKFTIVFMNSDCDYFVDEKLFYALSAGSVPVFMGTAKIREFLPGNLRDSIIEVRNFKTPKVLAAYLTRLATDEKAYNKFLKWKYQGFKFPESYANSSIGQVWDNRIPVFCRICQRLASGDLGRTGLPVETCERRNFSDWVEH